MKIGLISDSHDHVPHIEQAVKIFKDEQVDLVIHSGDFCSPFTVPPFEGVQLMGLFGNNDGDRYLLMQKFSDIGAEMKGDFFELEVEGRKLAVYHGNYAPITHALRTCGAYDAVISGHTHEKVLKHFEDTLAINPGTAHGFGEEASIALLEVETLQVRFITLDKSP